jgi:hypothetical protein
MIEHLNSTSQFFEKRGMHFRLRDELRSGIQISSLSVFVEDPTRTSTLRLIQIKTRSFFRLMSFSRRKGYFQTRVSSPSQEEFRHLEASPQSVQRFPDHRSLFQQRRGHPSGTRGRDIARIYRAHRGGEGHKRFLCPRR